MASIPVCPHLGQITSFLCWSDGYMITSSCLQLATSGPKLIIACVMLSKYCPQDHSWPLRVKRSLIKVTFMFWIEWKYCIVKDTSAVYEHVVHIKHITRFAFDADLRRKYNLSSSTWVFCWIMYGVLYMYNIMTPLFILKKRKQDPQSTVTKEWK